jgi:hypothetical protein
MPWARVKAGAKRQQKIKQEGLKKFIARAKNKR